jgi:hypothetical protein
MALGDVNGALEFEAFLFGALRPTRQEFNLIAAALNEYLIGTEARHAVPYIEDGPDS